MISTTMFVDPKICTQADRAQSSRVPVPLPEDPYEAIRQAYLVGMDTESKPFEDLRTESPGSPHIVASPTSLPDSTPPACHVRESKSFDTSGVRSMSSDSTAPLSPDHLLTHATPVLVLSLYRTVRMAVRVQPAMLPSYSAHIEEVVAMSDASFRKRFRSSYESSPSPSPTLPVWKRYKGTSELILGTDSEEDEDEEVEESSDSDSESEDAKDEGPATGDEGPTAGDEGIAARGKGPGIRVKSLGLGADEAVPKGQQRVVPVVETVVGEPLGLGYEVLRCWEIASREGQVPSVFVVGQDPEDGRTYIDVPVYAPPAPPIQTPPSPEWSSGSFLVSPTPSIVPSPVSSTMISLTVPSPVASPATTEAKGFLTKPALALEAWVGHVDTSMEDMSWAGYDDHRLVHDLLL
ncbi:hypothetical protein Tco_1278891 [Tanacetum coccineum]